VCHVLNHNATDDALADEAEFAKDWCIVLAEEIVLSEKAYLNGDNKSRPELQYTRDWVWERFRNLGAGLMSNGVRRK
jgi:hypothetical protein